MPPLTLTLELTPEEMRRIEAARDKGFDIRGLIRGLIAGLPEPPAASSPVASLNEKDQSALAWLETRLSQALTDPDEIAKADAELRELLENLNANRVAAGERPIFPE
jgi:hypothetical protein